jgi:hypothetical protein
MAFYTWLVRRPRCPRPRRGDALGPKLPVRGVRCSRVAPGSLVCKASVTQDDGPACAPTLVAAHQRGARLGGQAAIPLTLS